MVTEGIVEVLRDECQSHKGVRSDKHAEAIPEDPAIVVVVVVVVVVVASVVVVVVRVALKEVGIFVDLVGVAGVVVCDGVGLCECRCCCCCRRQCRCRCCQSCAERSRNFVKDVGILVF